MTDDMTDRLDKFRREVNLNLALGLLADEELSVVDDQGRHPVVAALSSERLAVLLQRVDNAGGYATAFVEGDSAVHVLAFIDSSCAIDAAAADDLVSDAERPDAAATVGVFLDYLALRPNGVRLPSRLESRERPFVPMPREVTFAG